MALKKWNVHGCDEAAAAEISNTLGIGMLVCKVLVSRGVTTPEAAQQFLDAADEPQDPYALADMEKAVERIRAAIENGERIEIFGDYDVDGITSTALLCEYLESCGALVGFSLPTREGEGYGLNSEAVEQMAQQGVQLIITVDNGVSSHAAIDYALECGIETVVTDHHKTPDVLPNAVAVVDPLRPDDGSAFKELAGVGVVLKLIAALEDASVAEVVENTGLLAALGTVSDAMPLAGENRYIVKEGLSQFEYYEKPGLRALCGVAGLDCANVDSRSVAFTIAPRLNAAGRIGSADTAIELLMTEDEERAAEIAQTLDAMNAERQATEREMIAQITDALAEDPRSIRSPILFFASENYNAGVAGIVCSRLVERYGRPAVILSISGDTAKGSGRSVPGFSLYDAIKLGEQYLQRFGGHDMAAGFTIQTKDIEAFKNTLLEGCKTILAPRAYTEFSVECVCDFSEINEQSVLELGLMSPFGTGNQDPVFATLGATLSDVSAINERHCRLQFKKNGRAFSAALFGTPCSKLPFAPGELVDVAYVLSIYNGARGAMVSAKIKAIRPAGIDDAVLESLTHYEGFFAGFGEPLACFVPTREDIAAVYRRARAGKLFIDDIEYMCYNFKQIPLGRVMAALDVLNELALLEVHNDDGMYVAATKNPPKKNLEDSPLFRRLHTIERGEEPIT